MSEKDDFAARRAALHDRIDAVPGAHGETLADRKAFFDAVYARAGDDAAEIPWADLKPKDRLDAWLAANPGRGRRAVDVACGLGDNAEAIAAAGWTTSAFDLSARAIGWAKERFPGSPVDYRIADLAALPAEWAGAFDMVHECYTIQSVPGELRTLFSLAIASLVAPGGVLLLYARTRPDEGPTPGPPWPLSPRESGIFAEMGFRRIFAEEFDLIRPDRTIPHIFAVWQRS